MNLFAHGKDEGTSTYPMDGGPNICHVYVDPNGVSPAFYDP